MKPFRPRTPGDLPIPPAGWADPTRSGRSSGRPTQQPKEQFRSFRASALYCPQCREATPVRERLLLVLPDGNLYDYRCVRCGTSTGSKTEKTQKDDIRIIY
jgi:hypothetical protein